MLKETFNVVTHTFDDAALRRVLGERDLLKDKRVMSFVQDIKK